MPAPVTCGEFSLGFNPHILNPMCVTSCSMKRSPVPCTSLRARRMRLVTTRNCSAVHWDMVLIQRPGVGRAARCGSDGELIRKNGMFIPGDLKPLNPAKLLK